MKKSLTPLGETEMEVLNHVWDMGEATVKQVRKRILEDREVAYTTIMTVMKNLARRICLNIAKMGSPTFTALPKNRNRSALILSVI